MTCKICGNNDITKLLTTKVLNKYDVQYLRCPNCEYIFTEEPYWLKEAYQRAINVSDTGLLDRNMNFANTVSILLYFFYGKKGQYLDYAGGFGVFTRLMRDIGFNFYWKDPYCENILAKGFEYDPDKQKNIQLLTAFEVFEHLSNPIDEIENMLKISKSILLSTELIPEPVPKQDDWWYYAFEHGQHISFYSLKTFYTIAEKLNLRFYAFHGLYMLTEKKINFTILKILLNFRKIGLHHLIKKVMKSKIWDDYLLTKNMHS